MPIYEYECENCGHKVEKFFPVIPRQIPKTVVDICTNENDDTITGVIRTFRRVMSSPNFHLKGGGWAKDGYSSEYQDGSKVVSLTEPK